MSRRRYPMYFNSGEEINFGAAVIVGASNVLHLGASGGTPINATNSGDVYVKQILDVARHTYCQWVSAAAGITVGHNYEFALGAAFYARSFASDAVHFAISATGERSIVVIDSANQSVDHAHGTQTYVTTFHHSSTSPATRADEFGSVNYNTHRIGADYGAYCQIQSLTEEVTIAVAAGNTPPVVTTGNLAPANSIILGVVFRVTDAPGGGATVLDIGITGGNLDGFIDGKSCDVINETGSSFAGDGDGVQTHPVENATATTLTLTTDADVGTDEMKVRVTVFYIVGSAPTA